MKMSEIVKRYVELRDKRAQLKAESAELKAEMDQIESKLLAAFDKLGVDSAKTPFGTAYTTTNTSAKVADKEVFMNFVRDTEQWELLETRAAKLAVEHYKEINGDLPPGISWQQETVVNVRQ